MCLLLEKQCISWLGILGKRENQMFSFARERDIHGMNPSERYLDRHFLCMDRVAEIGI